MTTDLGIKNEQNRTLRVARTSGWHQTKITHCRAWLHGCAHVEEERQVNKGVCMKHIAKNRKFGMRTLVLAAAAAATSGYAIVAPAAESWHTSTLKMVYPLADGGFVLIFDTDAPSCPGAGPNKYHYASPPQNGLTDEGAKKMYAAALTALAADKTVQVAFDNATTFCYVNRMSVVR
jgi:hypothetical protein